MLKTLVSKAVVDQIHEHEQRLAALSDEEIQAQTEKLRAILQERLGELRGRLAEKKQARHDCPDPAERDELNKDVHDLEEA
jgi:hypothetical protein